MSIFGCTILTMLVDSELGSYTLIIRRLITIGEIVPCGEFARDAP